VVTGRRADVLEPLAMEISGRAIAADLADRDAPARLAAEAGDVDVLVANAGLPGSGPLEDYTPEQIDRALDVNLRAPMLLARELTPAMVARGEGHLVFISSLSGKIGTGRSAIYSATKFGLRGFAQGLREDLRPRGVGVSTVFPGFIRGAGMFADTGLTLPRGVGTNSPAEVANAVVEAIERNRFEIDVAPVPMRLTAALAGIAPGLIAAMNRRAGARDLGDAMTEAQRVKR
jgi:uncharacterized protein